MFLLTQKCSEYDILERFSFLLYMIYIILCKVERKWYQWALQGSPDILLCFTIFFLWTPFKCIWGRTSYFCYLLLVMCEHVYLSDPQTVGIGLVQKSNMHADVIYGCILYEWYLSIILIMEDIFELWPAKLVQQYMTYIYFTPPPPSLSFSHIIPSLLLLWNSMSSSLNGTFLSHESKMTVQPLHGWRKYSLFDSLRLRQSQE